MEEIMTVSMDALSSDMETMQADAVSAEEVELLGAMETQESGESVSGTEPQAAAAPELRYTQEEFDEAVRRKSDYIRNGLKNDPIYQFAQSLVNRHMAEGVSPEEAIAKAKAEQREQLIAELSADPKRMAEFFLNQQQPMSAPQPQNDLQARSARLASELKTLEVQGALPQNFQLETYKNADPELFVNAEQYGWKAAMKIAEAKMASVVPTQPIPAPAPVLPQSTRPTNSAQPSTIDFSRMDTKRFNEFEARVAAALAEGKRVVF